MVYSISPTTPDYEAPADIGPNNVYQVDVLAADGTSTTTHAVTVTVTNVNEDPVFPDTEDGLRTVVENTLAGVNVGNPIRASDPEGDSLTYTLTGNIDTAFEISSSGQLSTKITIDREAATSYTGQVQVRDSKDADGNSDTNVDASTSVVVTVEDINEPPVVTGTTTTEYAENDTRSVETYSADDPENNSITWSLSGADSDAMDITRTGGELSFNDAPNYEAKSVYLVIVQASDGHSTTTHAVRIDIADMNEQAQFPGATTSRSVAENTPAGQNIGAPVSATDPDRGDSLTYILGGSDADLFGIATSTGQILTKAALDADIRDEYNVYVDVHDGKDADGNPDTNYDNTINVTITVENVNEAPVVTGAITTEYVENGNGAVATYTAADPESDDVAWSPSGTDGGAFTMSEFGVLSFIGPPDHEYQEEYSVTVNAFDGKLSGSLDVTITITDVNEPPDVTGRTAITFVETATGPVETFKANDPEESDTDITWEVLGTDAGDFTITNGALNFASTPDYHFGQDNTYDITIKATDDAVQSDTLDVTVIVTDVNEVPVFPGATTNP